MRKLLKQQWLQSREIANVLEKVTSATSEPISLAEAKDHLRVTSDDDDQLIRSYVKAATEYCEQQVPGSRAFIQQTWDWKLHEFPGDSFELPRPPMQSLTTVKYYATSASTGLTTLSSMAYIVHSPTSMPGMIERHPNGAAWPSHGDRADAVQVRFVAGYSTVPEQVKHAVRLVVGAMYEQRSAVLSGTSSKEIEFGVKSLLGSIGYGSYT